jgi:hypothetical protein
MCVSAWTAAPASAQWLGRPPAAAPASSSTAQTPPEADVHGIVLDERGEPLSGVVLSALGSTTVFAVSGRDGRFSFRNLPYGPYLLRAHLQGYASPRAQLLQVNRSRVAVSTIELSKRADADTAVPVLAGVGGSETATSEGGEDSENHDHSEVAWRLRHLKRSVLKSAAAGVIPESGDRMSVFGRAVGTPARVASSLFADVPWNGHVDLLTSTSFDRPQDLWSMPSWPRGVAFVSLEAPTSGGLWAMRGALSQGDLSSWIVAGSYRRGPAAHQYEAGLSYGVQRYFVGTTDAGRSVGAVYAYDNWTVNPHVAVSYGAKYARYDYLGDPSLLSPRVSATVTPTGRKDYRVTAAVSRQSVAPGAEEFLPPMGDGLWLPPERTFSSVASWRGFQPERVQHVEIGAEREWADDTIIGVRWFHQDIEDQLVTLFGIALPGAPAAPVGHYYVATAGDAEAQGWGVRVSRSLTSRVYASIDYTRTDAEWVGRSPDRAALTLVAVPIGAGRTDRFHDVTTSIDGTVPVTETRVVAVYKVNSRLFDGATGIPRSRFDVQFNQALPFVRIGGAEWEMLLALKTLFREGLVDASVYDEILVVRPPKRIVGGVTVRF